MSESLLLPPDVPGNTEPDLLPRTYAAVSEFRNLLNATFEGDERQQLEEALWLMCEVHAGQEDRADGTPYTEHPLAVARGVIMYSTALDRRKVIAALLHDTVEDQAGKLAAKARESGITGEDETVQALGYIEARFGSRVAAMVSRLSHPDFAAQLAVQGKEPTAKRLNKRYLRAVTAALEDPDTALIKLFDVADKLPRLTEAADFSQRRKRIRKYSPVVGAVIDILASGGPSELEPDARIKLVGQFREARDGMARWMMAYILFHAGGAGEPSADEDAS